MTALEKRSVNSLALLYSFRMLGLFMVLPLLALYAVDLPGATPALVGLALGIYGLSQALLQIPLGWLSDWVGRKPIIIGGLFVFALGSLVAATADTMGGLILGRFLQGAGAIASTVMALAADLTRPEQRTKAMALIGVSIGLSFAVALVVGPALANFGGIASVFYATAGLALVGVVIVWLLVPTPDQRGQEYAEVGARLALIPRSLRNVSLLRLDAGVFILHFVLMACFLLVPSYLEQTAGIPRESHWLVYLPALALSIAGMVPMMIVAERRKRPRGMFIAALLMLVAALAALGLASEPMLLLGGLWLFFVGFNYLEATLPSMVSKVAFEGGKGTALGVYSTSQYLGIFCGGAVGGWVQQQFAPATLIGLCLALVLVWLVMVFPARHFTALAAGDMSGA
jgi:predicted MFS family arabinose efflux permease